MALESELPDVDPNYKRDRFIQRVHANEAMEQARWRLDSAMRGTQDAVTRTLISTAYDLVRQAEGLMALADKTDPNVVKDTTAAGHPWKEYNLAGNACHYPGCMKTEDEHAAKE